MAACSGAALSIISRPEQYGDSAFSAQLREAVIAAVVVTDYGSSRKQRARVSERSDIATAAATLLGRLANETSVALTDAEQAVLVQWLRSLADMPRLENESGRPSDTSPHNSRKESR
jgi:hypothetical protein